MLWNVQPTLLCNVSGIVQNHFTVFDFSEAAYSALYLFLFSSMLVVPAMT
jgi:hypothetical protein